MNNDFLRHLQSITPQGKAEEKKIFIPADKFKEMEDERDESEELDEAYDRKFMKAIRRGDREAEDIAKRRWDAAQVRRAGGSEKAQRLAGSGIYNPYETDLNWAKDKFMWDSRAKAASGKRRAKQRKMNEEDELDEATRSKYLKLKYGTKGPYGNKVTDDTIELARKKHDAAILRRGGASPEAIKRGVAKPFGNDHEVDMAKYRFHNKRARHLETLLGLPQIKTNKKAKMNEEELGEGWKSLKKTKADLNAIRAKGYRVSVQHGEGDTLYRVSKKKKKRVNEEELGEGVRRMRRLRTSRLKGTSDAGKRKGLDAAYDKELAKLSASRLRRGGARKSTIRSFMSDKPTTKAADKAYEKFSRGAMQKANARGHKIFEDEMLNEGSYVPKQREARWQRKGSRKLLRKALASGDKKGAEEMKGNIRDAEQFIRSKKMNEAKKPNPIKKAKKLFKKLKRAAGRAYDVLSTPQQDVDYMLTGRKF